MTLSVPQHSLVWNERMGAYTSVSGVPYNPGSSFFGGTYTLTTKDSIEYEIDGTTGDLVAAKDLNENELTFTEGGIFSDTGVAVTFERDAKGRITEITDPDGEVVRYEYDAAGDLVAVTDREEITTTFGYGVDERPHYLDEIIDPLERPAVRTEYDEKGRLKRTLDVNGEAVEIDYDPENSMQTVEDVFGNPTTYVYDDRGNVLSEIDPLGKKTERTYNEDNNVIEEKVTFLDTDLEGNEVERVQITSSTYDPDGNLLSRTDPLGNTRHYSYNAFGQLLSSTDPLGNTKRSEYDLAGNLIATISPRGARSELIYDARGNLVEFIDPYGSKSSFTFDEFGNLVEYIDPLGRKGELALDFYGNILWEQFEVNGENIRHKYSYNSSGKLTSVELPNKKVATIEWNSLGLPEKLTNVFGEEQIVTYNQRNNFRKFTDFNQKEIFGEWDASGQLIKLSQNGQDVIKRSLDPLGRPVEISTFEDLKITTTYDGAGRIVRQERLGKGVAEYQYDDSSRLIKSKSFDGKITRYEYDDAGRITANIDSSGDRTEFLYDADGNLVMTSFPNGSSIKTEYDLLGRVIAVENQAGTRIEYVYDKAGQLSKVVDTAGHTTSYIYDDMGNISEAILPNGSDWNFTYDLLGNITSRTFPWGGTEQYYQDEVGNITKITDPTGKVSNFNFNNNGKVINKEFTSGYFEERLYDDNSNIEVVRDNSGETSYYYTPSGLSQRVEYPGGLYVEYQYDDSNRLITLESGSGITNYRYNDLGQLSEVIDSEVGGTKYTYNDHGLVEKLFLPDGSVTDYTYDNFGLVEELQTFSKDNDLIRHQRYTRDLSGNPIKIEELDREIIYKYDNAGRLIFEKPSELDNEELIYSYDKNWNLLGIGNEKFEYDENLQILNDAEWNNYIYDLAGRPLSRSNVNSTELFTYDSIGRLTRVEQIKENNQVKIIELEYSHTGLLDRIVVDGNGRKLIWNITQEVPTLLEERSDSGELIRRYVHGITTIATQNADEVLIHHVDRLGSNDLITSQTGSVMSDYAFNAYGKRILPKNSDIDIPLGFTGEYFIPEIGLYYLRSRFYNPSNGRFLTPDLIQTEPTIPLTYNPYSYAAGNPVSLIDPLGTYPSIGEVSQALTIAGTLASLAWPGFTAPGVALAKKLGLGEVEKVVGVSLAASLELGSIGGTVDFAGGLQMDAFFGLTKDFLGVSAFAGAELGQVRNDPRALGPFVTGWVGPILGTDGDPSFSNVSQGLYLSFSGSLAHSIAQGTGSLQPWSRGASIIQIKVGDPGSFFPTNIDRSGLTIYGNFQNVMNINSLGRGAYGDRFERMGRLATRIRSPITSGLGAGVSLSYFVPLYGILVGAGGEIETRGSAIEF